MLGQTNALYVSDGESGEMQAVMEAIVTVSSSNIWKLECLNGHFFAFLYDGNVLHGADAASLAPLELGIDGVGGGDIYISHAIYADGKFCFAVYHGDRFFSNERYDDEASDVDAVIYRTSDFTSFEVIQIGAGHNISALYTTSAGKIFIGLMEMDDDGIVSSKSAVVDTLDGYDADAVEWVGLYFSNGTAPLQFNIPYAKFINDRLFVRTYGSTSGDYDYHVVTPDGTRNDTLEILWYAGGYYIRISTSGRLSISINGVDFYLKSSVSEYEIYTIVDLEDGLIGVFYDSDAGRKFAVATAVEDIPASLADGVGASIPATPYCSAVADGYVYLGCSGGTILRYYIDYSGDAAIPEVAALKTLSAKQALSQAKEYADQGIAALEARVAALEAAT